MSTLQPETFIKQHHYGVLSTHSLKFPGFPFGSVVPYVISDQGKLCIYISELAEHTKNIQADSKIAFTISDCRDNRSPSSGARITCLGIAHPSEQQENLKEKYRILFADAELILSLPGFTFYEIELEAIRLIAGFGQIEWLTPTDLQLS